MNAHTVAYHRRAILARTSLIELRNAIRTARSINDRATIDTINTELARRQPSHLTAWARKPESLKRAFIPA